MSTGAALNGHAFFGDAILFEFIFGATALALNIHASPQPVVQIH